MASTLMYLAVLVVTGTLLGETSAISLHKATRSQKRNFMQEAKVSLATASNKVRFNLAPTYGELDSKSLQQLDKNLKMMIGGILSLDLKKQYTWNELKSSLEANPFMTRDVKSSIDKLERITFSSVTVFLGSSTDRSTREVKIREWFTNLIGNVDILEDTDIDLDQIVQLVSKFGVSILKSSSTHTKKRLALMDQGILRFPDISRPFFTLYRITLLGKCTYVTYLMHQTETSDVVGLFNREIYYPDQNYINSLTPDLYAQILEEIEDLFSDL